MTKTTQLACACGRVRFAVEAAPIISAECHCNSCRAASERLERLPEAPRVRNPNGGTPYVLYRKDRVQFLEGAEVLKEFRLKPESPTRRVVASCCNTPLFLEFKNGHWLSLYGALWRAGSLPAMELRTMTSDLPKGTVLDNKVPSGKRQSAAFFARLFGAWVAMRFRTPKIPVHGEIKA